MAQALEKLIDAMEQELQWQRDLAAVLEHKLDAMRHHDISRLEALTQAEQRLLDGIYLNAGKRNAAALQATQQLFNPPRPKAASARELAAAVKEPTRGKLIILAAMLRDIAQKVQSLNRINALATQKMQGYFQQIFSIIALSGRDIGLYGRSGKRSLPQQNRLVDAIA